MAKFCTECGKEIAAGVAFCTECGAKAPADPAVETTETVTEAKETKVETPVVHTPPAQSYQAQQQIPPQPPQQAYPQPQQVYAQPVYQQTYTQPAPDPASKVVGTGAYFWLMLLFTIPIIGFISCLIMAFAPKNKNIKHFARAQLIWMIIGIIIAALVIGGIFLLINTFSDYIAEAIGGEFNGLGDLFEQFQNGGFEDMPSNIPTN